MRKLLPLIVILLLIVVYLATGCTTSKNGCGTKWKQPKQKVYRGFLSVGDEPRNIQVKVDSVLEREKNRVELLCHSMEGECVMLRYGGRNSRLITKGTWLTVYGDYDNEKGIWIETKIKLNF